MDEKPSSKRKECVLTWCCSVLLLLNAARIKKKFLGIFCPQMTNIPEVILNIGGSSDKHS